jgi:hypothetical protein
MIQKTLYLFQYIFNYDIIALKLLEETKLLLPFLIRENFKAKYYKWTAFSLYNAIQKSFILWTQCKKKHFWIGLKNS